MTHNSPRIRPITGLVLLMLLAPLYGHSQVHKPSKQQSEQLDNFVLAYNNDIVEGSNKSNYGIEYELVNYTFPQGDSSILETLNLQNMYKRRFEYEDRLFHDIQQGVSILVYSYQKAVRRRSSSTLNERN